MNEWLNILQAFLTQHDTIYHKTKLKILHARYPIVDIIFFWYVSEEVEPK